MEWFKKALQDIKESLLILGGTIKELLDSKRAILLALGVAVPAVASAFPQYKEQLDQVVPYAEAGFALLALLYTFRPVQTAAQG